MLNQKTGLGINLCKKIVKGADKKGQYYKIMTSDIKKTKHPNDQPDTKESDSYSQQRVTPDHQLEYKKIQHTDENLIT